MERYITIRGARWDCQWSDRRKTRNLRNTWRVSGCRSGRVAVHPGHTIPPTTAFTQVSVKVHFPTFCFPPLATSKNSAMKIQCLFTTSISTLLLLAQLGLSQCNCGYVHLCSGFFHPEDGYCCNGIKRQVLFAVI